MISKSLLAFFCLACLLALPSELSGLEPASEELVEMWQSYDQISAELNSLLSSQTLGVNELLPWVENLTRDLLTLQSEVSDLLAQQRNLYGELTELRSQSRALVEELERLQQDINELLRRLEGFGEQLRLLENDIARLGRQNTALMIGGIVLGIAVLSIGAYVVAKSAQGTF